MKNRIKPWISVLAFLALPTSPPAYAQDTFGDLQPQGNVILVTLDGVRWQEFFHGLDPSLAQGKHGDIFSSFWTQLSGQGVIFGNSSQGNPMTVANTALVSLPAYQSITAGYVQPCRTNSCGRISVETVQERLVRELALNPQEVATIGSWTRIAYAAEHVQGRTFVNTGLTPLLDGDDDQELRDLNRDQIQFQPPWGDARFDRFTFAHALRYIRKHHPRFLHIALTDSDEWAHRGNYANYAAILRQYDTWIKVLTDALDELGEYGQKTTLLVTTDHGRGTGFWWRHHGCILPDSKYIWLYGRSPYTRTHRVAPQGHYTHIDIRPTIEAGIGISPVQCRNCGHVIQEIVPLQASFIP